MSSAAHAEASLPGYYARRAQEYERIYTKPERQEDLRTLRDFVGQTFAGKDVLELACGTGYWTEILSQTANSVSAIDINEEVLAIARDKPMDHHKVTILRGDIYALPEFPKPFSAGLAVFWWSHVPKVAAARFPEESATSLRSGRDDCVHRQHVRGRQQHADLAH